MSSITEAVFKGRGRRGMPAPPEAPRHSAAPLTTQFMARKAIEAVLAGGYTKCEAKTPQQPLPPAAPQVESRSSVRSIAIWVTVFGVAGLLGIATSRLPGHAVHAKTAAPRTEVVAEELAEPPAPTAPTARRARPEAPAEAPAALAQAAPADDLEVPLLRAQLRPVSKRPALLPDAEVASLAAPMADDAPLTSRVAARGGAANAPALEEVLYEGEPAQGARATAPRAAAQAEPGTDARADSTAAGQGESRGGGKLKVEGIFWDKVRPMAIIGGKIVEAGSVVGSYTVREIQQGRVIVDGGGLTLELRP